MTAGPADVGDGHAHRARCAETYAALLRRQRDELHQTLLDVRALTTRLPETQAVSSRDFGRGYALACSDLAAAIDHALQQETP